MRKIGKIGIAAASVLVIAAATNAAVLELRLEADDVIGLGVGDTYNVRLYATAIGTDPTGSGGGGIFNMTTSMVTPDHVGISEPKEAGMSPPAKKLQTITTWSPAIVGGFSQINPARKSAGIDADNDSVSGGFYDVWTYTNDAFAKGVEALVYTQVWKVLATGQVRIATQTDPLANYYDYDGDVTTEDPQFPGDGFGFSRFDSIEESSLILNIGGAGPVWEGPEAPEIIAGRYPEGATEEMWTGPGGWNNPEREITLSLDGPPGGLLVDAEWDFGGGLLKNGLVVTVNVGELLGAGWVADPPLGASYPVNITLIQEDGATSPGQMDVFLPEPGTMALLGLGCLGTILRRRRK